MSPTAATMGSAIRGEESEETVYDTAADVESGEEMQELEQQEEAGDEEPANAEGLHLGYCIVPSEKRFLVLHAFLKRKLSKKVMVIFSSCSSVKFHAELLGSLQMECAGIHEKQKQKKRAATFSNFCNSEKGILLCTNVAARGLDIPDVDYIVQYDPLNKLQDYIHNAEQTARAEKGKGSVILFLLPQELEFLISLTAANIRLTEYELHNKNVPSLQSNFEKIVGENYFLHQLAQEAYRSYILAYNSNAMKKNFNVHGLNFKDVAASFSIRNPPKVNIDPERRDKKKVGGGGKRQRINAAA
ncbi:DEAD-box ATP-dependent RNA helicase 27-like [Lolium rigidum]|uniref:DEAD-box ATP-dependent RNA helicase 27-like n=1 Tax=Lolium rigidum TaxID=89674 RepID=UPI001F5C52DF|nr:DEAD-box ATP-dependent RNA helicase 27-like [Lolium rigidum]